MDEHDRPALLARWLMLTRTVLPAMAPRHGWPIRADHCFMRVFLDHAAGGRWDHIVPRPAIRNMPAAMLAQAVALAEQVVAQPWRLPPLNATSLAWRRDQRRVGARTGADG